MKKATIEFHGLRGYSIDTVGLNLQAMARNLSIEHGSFDADKAVEELTREDWHTIVNAGIRKFFGARCFWFADSGLGLQYGQVFKALKRAKRDSNPGNSSVTDRIRIDVVIDGIEIDVRKLRRDY